MEVVQVTDSIASKRGGTSRSIPALCEALARRGSRVTLCAGDFGTDYGPPVAVEEALVTVRTVPCWVWC